MAKKIPVFIPVYQGNLLVGRTALITGGTKGIGFEIAKSFLLNGASVVITGRDNDRLKKAVDELCRIKTEKCFVRGIVLDNAQCDLFEEKFLQIQTLIGTDAKLDVLVNNAGIINNAVFGVVREDDFDAVINTNLKGIYLFSQIVARYMKKNNIQGNILNIASSSSLRPAITPYLISKWGIRGFTIGLAKTLIPYGIVVNGLAPGPTATSMLGYDEYSSIELGVNPAGRYVTPQEIANMAVFLVSNMGRMVVGDIVYMTGGAGIITIDDIEYPFRE